MLKIAHVIINFVLGLCFLSCKSENNKIEQFENITVDKNLSENDTFKILSKYYELKLFNSEKLKVSQERLILSKKIDFIVTFINTGTFSSMIINVKQSKMETPPIFGLTITMDILETVF